MMNTNNVKKYLGCMGAAAAAVLVVGAMPAPASAQSDFSQGGGYGATYNGSSDDYAYRTPQEMDGVTVYAPRHMDRDPATGAPYERVSASRIVDYSDLDPSTPYGHHILRVRVQHAAEDACGQIDRAYPDTTDDQPPCVRSAVHRAMYEVDQGGGY